MSGESQTTTVYSSSADGDSPRNDRSTRKKRSAKTRWGIAGGVIAIVVVVLLVVLLLRGGVAGFERADVRHDYGERLGDSVNGTSVLARMFQESSHKVSTWPRLSPRIEGYDTIVWFPDRFTPPGVSPSEQSDEMLKEWRDKGRKMLEEWLRTGYDRTLVYVARDYDAEVAYWERVAPGAPEDEAEKIDKRLEMAKTRHNLRRGAMLDEATGDWFVMRRGGERRKVDRLSGVWSNGVSSSKAWMEIRGTVEPLPGTRQNNSGGYRDIYRGYGNAMYAEKLLTAPRGDGSGEDTLVMRLRHQSRWGSGKIIVVANGSFLLNMPLVNHEHRKLAGKLIDECGYPGDVLFLESGPEPLEVRETEAESNPPVWITVTKPWPLRVIVIHVALCGTVLCFAMFPIFGRPRETEKESQSDFSKHIDAMGTLLAQTEDYNYAKVRISYYHEKVKRESGVGHKEARKDKDN